MDETSVLTIDDLYDLLIEKGFIMVGEEMTDFEIKICRAVEEAVLQSEKVQGWKKDSERWRAWRKAAVFWDDDFFKTFNNHDTSPYFETEEAFDASIDAAMEKKK